MIGQCERSQGGLWYSDTDEFCAALECLLQDAQLRRGLGAQGRKFVAALLPSNPLVPIPRDDEIYTKRAGYDLSDAQYTKAAGGHRDYPQLEGVKINGHWAIIYSKYDIGCALERHTGIECKGYTYDSALKIAGNIVIYSTFP